VSATEIAAAVAAALLLLPLAVLTAALATVAGPGPAVVRVPSTAPGRRRTGR
jgi:hypothetical protein